MIQANVDFTNSDGQDSVSISGSPQYVLSELATMVDNICCLLSSQNEEVPAEEKALYAQQLKEQFCSALQQCPINYEAFLGDN